MTALNITQPRLPQLHYQQLGQGDHLILIHGLFGSLENLNMVARQLKQNYCVTSIDVRNHGQSFHKAGMAYPDLAQDVIHLLDDLSINKCHILGHSMGGKIAMELALSHPNRVNKLIIADIAPVTYPAHHSTIIEGLLAIDVAKIQQRKEAMEQLAFYEKNVGVRQFLLRNLVTNSQDQFIFRCNLNHIAKGYPQIMQFNNNQSIDDQNTKNKDNRVFSGNTLFIKGGNSDYILPEHKDSICALFPTATFKIIQGVSHWLHAEKTTAFNKLVENFLDDIF